ncbi:hypothetical protein F4775DRAFT_552559 [Biscogniauxia sp. FL1348]|nr:hypothetical protein F4775DRAFT_552559 [Biscogniauxia sp. FL1348]
MEMTEASGPAVQNEDDPPPYGQCPDESEHHHQDNNQQQPSGLSQLASPCPSCPPHPFPTSWGLYHQPLTRVLLLGSHEDKPIYAVSHHTGWYGQPDMILHNGPSEALPMLAATQRSSTFGDRQYCIIILPPLPGSALDSSQEILRLNYDWPMITFRFTVEIGATPERWHREGFEWRHSYRMVASVLDGVGDGWKLVRLSTADRGKTQERRPEAASDGGEIVAVWGYARKSLTKAMKFSFLGSGASGVLGDRWALTTVMTALRMYQGQERHWDWL